MALDDFPRYPLMFGPSPVHPLDRLSEQLGGASIWAKREDCNSGLAYGGNKVRKLEYLVPDALAQGADTLVSIGGVQSNHTRQVAAVAAKLGLRARLVQESWVDWPDVANDRVGNILLSRIMGAHVELVEAGFGIGVKSSWAQALDDVRAAGGVPYPIPAGASDHPLGGLGFANWAYEVQQQERELVLPSFTHDDAWRLGTFLVGLAIERRLSVVVDIRHGDQVVFHAARPGTSADNDTWVERKVRVVRRFGRSSYLAGLQSTSRGTTFEEETRLPLQEYAGHGGAFPVRVAGVGQVGVVAVSGLAGSEDHALVVEGLRALLAGTI